MTEAGTPEIAPAPVTEEAIRVASVPEQSLVINSRPSLLDAIETVQDLAKEHGYLVLVVKSVGGQRSNQQNKGMHKYFEMLAQALNAGGFHQKQVLNAIKEGVEIPNTAESVKELWRQIQIAILDKDSTAKLERPEVSRVHRALNKWTFDTFNIDIPFPSED